MTPIKLAGGHVLLLGCKIEGYMLIGDTLKMDAQTEAKARVTQC